MTRPAIVPTALALAAVSAVATGLLLMPRDRFTPDLLLFLMAVATLAIVGAFLAAKVPENRIGWLLLLSGLLFGLGMLSGGYAFRSLDTSAGLWPAGALAAWLNNVLFVPPIVIVTVGVPLVFPDGHLLSARWCWVAVALALGAIGATLRPAFAPGPMGDTLFENPFGLPDLVPALGTIDTISAMTAIPVFIAAVISVATRWRRGGAVERQQLKWLIAVASVAAVAFPFAFVEGTLGLTFAANIAWYAGFLAIAALPVAIAVAILRYRLYDIDRIISRTIAYAAVTGILVATFAGAILLFQALLDPLTGGNTVAVAVSTLIVAALFQPLRRRIQRAVDRRFNRSRYDAEQIASEFADHLRDEVDLAMLHGDLLAVVERSLQPTLAGVWLRDGRANVTNDVETAGS